MFMLVPTVLMFPFPPLTKTFLITLRSNHLTKFPHPTQTPTIDLITRSGRVLAPSGPGETSNPQKNDDLLDQGDENCT